MSDKKQIQLTGIAELDQLLNLKTKFRENTTTAILIRGGQGAGKTTLALQILANQLKKEDSLGKKNHFGLFLSLERSAKDAIEYSNNSFGFKMDFIDGIIKPDGTVQKVVAGKVLGIDGHVFREKLKKCFLEKDFETQIKKAVASIVELIKVKFKSKYLEAELDGKSFRKQIEEKIKQIEKERSETFDTLLAEVVSEFRPERWEPSHTLWLVVDSLNVLERAIFQRTDLEKYRGAIQGFASALHKKLGAKKVVILFTGEYHTPNHDVSGASSESFFSDIEILLSQEPLVGSARTDPRNSAAAGYNIELQQSLKAGWNMNALKTQHIVVETRPFCRVLKSRFSEHQSRRCSYKIEERKGLLFDEVFPGDGYVLLFEDNPRQRDDWYDFLLKDALHEFPALRHELFDRTHQQRVFSTERCFGDHCQATDLHLANFDTYWIKWFIELNQRSIIGKYLKPLREKIAADQKKRFPKSSTDELEEKTRKLFSKAICKIHHKFLSPIFSGKKSEQSKLLNKLKGKFGFTFSKVSPGEKKISECLAECWHEFNQHKEILLPIPKKDLRLFGEQRSQILSDLLQKHEYIFDNKKENLLSVPFNANISFLVYRKDLLNGLAKTNTEGDLLKFRSRLIEIVDKEKMEIGEFIEAFRKTRAKAQKTHMAKAFEFPNDKNDKAARERFLTDKSLLSQDYVPRTWEEVIVLCELYGWEHLIETRSFDTLLCTFLELVWGCGADLEVNAEYEITITDDFLARFYQAVFLFQELLKHAPENATLDAHIFGKYVKGYPCANGQRVKKEDWAFMRQWHSTLVDVLVTKADKSNYCWTSGPEKKKNAKAETKTDSQQNSDSKPALEITSLPESFWRFYGEGGGGQKMSGKGGNDKGNKGLAGQGISCWGDWHLAVLRGSENMKLAVGLVNNLMSSSKISTRALSGAAMPAVEEFYKIYKADPCVHLPERSGDFQMPRRTYGEVKDKFFPIARTRSKIFDYRHVMREIHGFVVELVYNRRDHRSPEQVSKVLNDVFRRINALSERELLLH